MAPSALACGTLRSISSIACWDSVPGTLNWSENVPLSAPASAASATRPITQVATTSRRRRVAKYPSRCSSRAIVTCSRKRGSAGALPSKDTSQCKKCKVCISAIGRTCATLSAMPVQANELGRRERKSQRTRRQIIRAAAELVLEHGYERATIARIADRADLATRTVTTRFPTKEAIFFEGIEHALERVELRLGATDGDVVDRLRAWIGEMSALAETDPEDPELRAL